MSFKVFVSYGPRGSGINVSILKGKIGLSKGLAPYFASKGIQIEYDKDSKSIGLRPVEDGGRKIYKNGQICCAGLFDYLGLTTRVLVSMTWDEKEQMFIGKLP